MKKLLYSGLMALMMLFAIGTANAGVPAGTTEDASFFTITPATGNTVNTGALLSISTTSEAAMVVYYSFPSQEKLNEQLESDSWNWIYGEEYSDKAKPVINKDQCAFLIAANVEGGWKYVSVNYTISTGALPAPTIQTTMYVTSGGKISKDDYIQIVWGGETEEPTDVEYWYTTDGTTTPAKGGSNSTQYESGSGFKLGENENTVMAIAVSGEQTSAVSEAHYTFKEDVVYSFKLMEGESEITDDKYGKYSPFTVNVYEDGVPVEDNYAVLYTIDGTTEPDMDAYYQQEENEEGLPTGPIKMTMYGMSPSSEEEGGMERVFATITLTENTTSLKMKAYIGESDQEGTNVVAKTMTAREVPALQIDKAAGTVASGTTVKVTNVSDYDMIYYTRDGSIPYIARLYDDDEDLFAYDEENGIVINETQTIKVVGYKAEGTGKASGSDMVTRDYTVEVPANNDPTLAVKEAGKFTKTVDTVVFDGAAAFDAFVAVPADNNKDNYTIEVTYADAAEYLAWWSGGGDSFETLNIGSFDVADSVRIDFTGIYNGEYVAWFSLKDKTVMSGEGMVENSEVGIFFNVTNYEAPNDLKLDVKAVGNTEEDGKIIFAKGENIAFDIFVKDLAADDTNYKVDVYIWTKEEAENGAGADATRFNAKDSIRFNAEGVYFNNEYVAKFELLKYNDRNELGNADNAEITFFVTENPAPADPELTVKAVGGTEGEDGKVAFANGKAAFDMFVTGVAKEDTTYALYVTVWNTAEEDFIPEPDILNFADSVRFENDYFNGEYEATFELRRRDQRGEYGYITDQMITFVVTGGEDRPELTVKPVGNTMKEGKVVFADGNAAFDMFVKGVAKEDTTYALYVTVWNTADEDFFPEPDILNFADSVRFENDYFNGEYEATFELRQLTKRGEYGHVLGQKITFMVTEGKDRPEISVKPVGNTEKDGEIIFADGNVAFDMFVKGVAKEDTTYAIYVTVWNTAEEENYPLADVFKVADSVRFVNMYYNGEYEAVFELRQLNQRGEYGHVMGQKLTFSVTENEEPVEKYELTVKAVEATLVGDTAWFTGKVVFDMFAAGYVEGDSLAVTIYTPAEFEDTLFIEPKLFVAAADSVRFETTLDKGTIYVGVFELLHKDSKRNETITVKDVVMHIAVGNVAVEAAELAGVNVYPNPNAGNFNVAVPERARIDIFGLNGAKVMSREVNAGVEAFQLNHSGIYFVRVMAGNKTAVKRVVVR